MGYFGSLYPYALLLLQLSAIIILANANQLRGRPYFVGFVTIAILNNLISRAHPVFSAAGYHIEPTTFLPFLNIMGMAGYLLFLVGLSKSIGPGAPSEDRS